MIKLNWSQIGPILAITALIIIAGCSSPNNTAQEAVKLDNSVGSPVNSSAQSEACNPNWNCTEWSNCTSGRRFRSCTNSCGILEGMPFIVEECQQTTSQQAAATLQECIPEWDCTQWSSCKNDDTQTRTCIDKHNCNTSENVPAIRLTCAYAGLLDKFDLKKSLDKTYCFGGGEQVSLITYNNGTLFIEQTGDIAAGSSWGSKSEFDCLGKKAKAVYDNLDARFQPQKIEFTDILSCSSDCKIVGKTLEYCFSGSNCLKSVTYQTTLSWSDFVKLANLELSYSDWLSTVKLGRDKQVTNFGNEKQVYKNNQYGFSIDVPKDWVVTEGSGGLDLAKFESPDGQGVIMVGYKLVSGGSSMTTEEKIDLLRKGTEIVTNEEIKVVNGLTAYIIETVLLEVRLKMKAAYVIRDSDVFVVSYGARTNSDYETYSDEFSNSLNTFSIGD